jgi:hypothetical protein
MKKVTSMHNFSVLANGGTEVRQRGILKKHSRGNSNPNSSPANGHSIEECSSDMEEEGKGYSGATAAPSLGVEAEIHGSSGVGLDLVRGGGSSGGLLRRGVQSSPDLATLNRLRDEAGTSLGGRRGIRFSDTQQMVKIGEP